jgi:cell wall-associated NlpC family hydrolase
MHLLLFFAMAGNAVVVQPVANMYSKATVDADVVSQAIYSTYAQSGRVAQVEALFANLYREPNITKHQPLITIPFEARLAVVGEPEQAGGRWFKVRVLDDRSAMVQAGDVTLTPHSTPIPELLEWSTSTYDYDCSGFVQMLCRRDYSQPRDAGPQAEWDGVKAMENSELQPGDLLYFGSSAKRITHIGMYIGNGQFISIAFGSSGPWPEMQIHRIHRQIDMHDVEHFDFDRLFHARDMHVRGAHRQTQTGGFIDNQRADQIRRPVGGRPIVDQRPYETL